LSEKGLIFNIQRFSLHDGPGIRTTIFFKGCPLSCLWCQNPEGLTKQQELFRYNNKCIGCKTCIKICPEMAVKIEGRGIIIDRSSCRVCLICAENCPTGALEAVGKEVTLKELTDEVLKDRILFEESGGGATLSGGEPLIQEDFVAKLLKALKANNINTAVETGGYVSSKVIDKTAPWTDLYLYDLKLIDPHESIYYTGYTSSPVSNNLKHLVNKGCRLAVRMPLIPGINDHHDNIARVTSILRENGIKKLELIPYHNMAAGKYKGLDLEYRLPRLQPPTEKQVAAVKEAFYSEGIEAEREV